MVQEALETPLDGRAVNYGEVLLQYKSKFLKGRFFLNLEVSRQAIFGKTNRLEDKKG